MQQHLIWHEKHPDEDFNTCHICKVCGKVCSDYNTMKVIKAQFMSSNCVLKIFRFPFSFI